MFCQAELEESKTQRPRSATARPTQCTTTRSIPLVRVPPNVHTFSDPHCTRTHALSRTLSCSITLSHEQRPTAPSPWHKPRRLGGALTSSHLPRDAQAVSLRRAASRGRSSTLAFRRHPSTPTTRLSAARSHHGQWHSQLTGRRARMGREPAPAQCRRVRRVGSVRTLRACRFILRGVRGRVGVQMRRAS